MRQLMTILVLMSVIGPALADQKAEVERAARQAELDRACEADREKALAPIREDIYTECVTRQKKDPAFCRRDAAAFNGNRPGGAPRFYDLPACVAAFEFRNSYRR